MAITKQELTGTIERKGRKFFLVARNAKGATEVQAEVREDFRLSGSGRAGGKWYARTVYDALVASGMNKRQAAARTANVDLRVLRVVPSSVVGSGAVAELLRNPFVPGSSEEGQMLVTETVHALRRRGLRFVLQTTGELNSPVSYTSLDSHYTVTKGMRY